jgi:hypothetical protein
MAIKVVHGQFGCAYAAVQEVHGQITCAYEGSVRALQVRLCDSSVQEVSEHFMYAYGELKEVCKQFRCAYVIV